jgi:hypothetical protein
MHALQCIADALPMQTSLPDLGTPIDLCMCEHECNCEKLCCRAARSAPRSDRRSSENEVQAPETNRCESKLLREVAMLRQARHMLRHAGFLLGKLCIPPNQEFESLLTTGEFQSVELSSTTYLRMSTSAERKVFVSCFFSFAMNVCFLY